MNGHVSVTKTSLQVVRAEEGWASPDLLAKHMLRIIVEIFGFQPRYVARTNQVLSLGWGGDPKAMDP